MSGRFFVSVKILVSVVVVVAVPAMLYVFLTGRIFQIRDVEVHLVDSAEHSFNFDNIRTDINNRLKPLLGQYVWKVDIERIMKTVESDLRIKDAKISRVLPDKIQVAIEPHTPIANIMGRSTRKLYPVAIDGEVLPPVPALEAADSTILRGEEFIKNQDLRLQALELIATLPETGFLSQKSVSDIYYDKKKGFNLRLQGSGIIVWMGFDHFVERSKRSQRVLEYLEREQLASRIIDARYKKKVVVKLRNEP